MPIVIDPLLKVRNTQIFFFEIFKFVKVLKERNTLFFTESKKLGPNSRYKPSKLTFLNHGRVVLSDVIGAEMNSLVSE